MKRLGLRPGRRGRADRFISCPQASESTRTTPRPARTDAPGVAGGALCGRFAVASLPGSHIGPHRSSRRSRRVEGQHPAARQREPARTASAGEIGRPPSLKEAAGAFAFEARRRPSCLRATALSGCVPAGTLRQSCRSALRAIRRGCRPGLRATGSSCSPQAAAYHRDDPARSPVAGTDRARRGQERRAGRSGPRRHPGPGQPGHGVAEAGPRGHGLHRRPGWQRGLPAPHGAAGADHRPTQGPRRAAGGVRGAGGGADSGRLSSPAAGVVLEAVRAPRSRPPCQAARRKPAGPSPPARTGPDWRCAGRRP